MAATWLGLRRLSTSRAQPGGQSWWVATAAWTEPREPSAHPVPAYLVFTQVSGKWMQALEPDAPTGATPPPQVITHQASYALTVTVQGPAPPSRPTPSSPCARTGTRPHL
jgi:hypothetical protein